MILSYSHQITTATFGAIYDDVIKWKHFPRNWSFVRGSHRSPVNSLHKGQWCGALMFSLISASTNGWVINRDTGDLRRHRAHNDATVMYQFSGNSAHGKHLVWLHSAVIYPAKNSVCLSLVGFGERCLTNRAIFMWLYTMNELKEAYRVYVKHMNIIKWFIFQILICLNAYQYSKSSAWDNHV